MNLILQTLIKLVEAGAKIELNGKIIEGISLTYPSCIIVFKDNSVAKCHIQNTHHYGKASEQILQITYDYDHNKTNQCPTQYNSSEEFLAHLPLVRDYIEFAVKYVKENKPKHDPIEPERKEIIRQILQKMHIRLCDGDQVRLGEFQIDLVDVDRLRILYRDGSRVSVDYDESKKVFIHTISTGHNRASMEYDDLNTFINSISVWVPSTF